MSHLAQAAFVFDPPAVSEPEAVPDLASYDLFVVAFSGGKDSLALIDVLLQAGVPRSKIELWHHDVDGGGETLFDWACTPAYCREVAAALGLVIYFSHKVGGILGEMMRENSRTAPMQFQVPGGAWVQTGGTLGKVTTRLNWPAKAASLTSRWCSSYAKIDVMDAAIRNQDRFIGRRTLVLTGERAEESKSREKYKTFEPHRSDLRDGLRAARLVDHWRPVHKWSEQMVWDAMRRLCVVPHPAYRLGWSRLSCQACIFGSPHQWATIRAVFPARFGAMVAREESLGKTINFETVKRVARQVGLHAIADRGRPYPAALAQPELVVAAASHEWVGGPVLTNDWQLPAGAFGEDAAGPT